MRQGLRVRGVDIPDSELEWDFTTSGGPGGQHANRSNTAVELRFDLRASQSLPERLRERALRRLADQLIGGRTVAVTASDTRSQARNRQAALGKLRDVLVEATAPPAKPRRPTKPSRGAKRRRLEQKRRRSETKRLRKPPEH